MGSSTAATAHTSPVATTSPLSAIATIALSTMASGSSSSTVEEGRFTGLLAYSDPMDLSDTTCCAERCRKESRLLVSV